MYSIKITTEAETDLSEIYEYIYSVLKNPIAADNILNEIENFLKSLVDNPKTYALCNDIHLRQLGYRKIAIKNYLIFYKIDTATNTIYIMRIIYETKIHRYYIHGLYSGIINFLCPKLTQILCKAKICALKPSLHFYDKHHIQMRLSRFKANFERIMPIPILPPLYFIKKLLDSIQNKHEPARI